MATATLIPVEQYLSTSYRPDRDYVNGRARRRNLGEAWHSAVQGMITVIFGQHRHEWGLVAMPEWRVQVTPQRFRVPDVCVIRADAPFTPILRTAPVLCVEVLSTKDRFSRVMERVEEYIAMGVPAVWIIDPRSREIWTVGADSRPVPFTGEALVVEGTPARVPVGEIFALLDEAGETPSR